MCYFSSLQKNLTIPIYWTAKSQSEMKEKPRKRPRVPPKLATLKFRILDRLWRIHCTLDDNKYKGFSEEGEGFHLAQKL